ncbi:unnamed protein product [marine sediment metagenome]|uniref:Uncharacterized protein n=1 Tax=marine sediment metagenome TaxID=412755 RepID=X0W0I4_9ZZZZ
MLAYSTTNTPEDGPIPSNPIGTRPILPLDVTLIGSKGVALQRHSKLARDKMGHASTATLNVHRP